MPQFELGLGRGGEADVGRRWPKCLKHSKADLEWHLVQIPNSTDCVEKLCQSAADGNIWNRRDRLNGCLFHYWKSARINLSLFFALLTFSTQSTLSGHSCCPTASGAVAPHRLLPRTTWGASGGKRAAIHSESGGYSITSSARARIDCGTVSPSAFAVLRLTTSSKFVDCWTGRSAGLSPFKILPA
jgi:hypothetical protein